ncbi:glutamate-rich protein 6 [Synchiropus splendidus]|uniref:glutamate-rich protein 6 n=1 Tax=Synchiropus splendidus TaxID=270530 RepID=UPI00237E6254|nr:glutamate-rich protein 6 [Synchiropus splendidus]
MSVHTGRSQPLNYNPCQCIRTAGILKYHRESEKPPHPSTSFDLEPPTEYQVHCEFCGGYVLPSPDPTIQMPMRQTSTYCCKERRGLCRILKNRKSKKCDWGLDSMDSDDDCSTADLEELLFQGKDAEMHKDPRLNMDGVFLPQDDETALKVLRIRLPPAPLKGCLTRNRPASMPEKASKTKEEEPFTLPECDHKPLTFGVCHHQEGGVFLQKHYSDGETFLTLFPDGSAQIFYPSGLLALVVVLTKANGRVCIVYDDSGAPTQPIRAIFQSDGKVTCYHGDGSVWLLMDRSGGQCLNQSGVRVRRWSWSPSSTPLLPVVLSLNRNIGVRVMGREQVYLSFLAKSQQARLSVGCCGQCVSSREQRPSSPLVLKEELWVMAARIKVHLTIQNIHNILTGPTHPRLQKASVSPSLRACARRVVEACANARLDNSEQSYIEDCLQDCL